MPRKERKRKARRELVKTTDVTKPVIFPLEKIGTDEDPCFGKFNDPRHPICQKCGDIEICAIAMGQLNHIKRLMIEEKSSFKDVEETKIPPMDPQKIRIEIKKAIKDLIKRGPIEKDAVVRDVYGKYMSIGITQKKIDILFKKLVDKYQDNIIIKNNKYSWKKP
jgi:hypothetical protein